MEEGAKKTGIQEKDEKKHLLLLSRAAAAALSASGPVLPGAASPGPHKMGAVGVGGGVARWFSTAAGAPVHIVDLEEPNVVGTVGVVVLSVGVTSGLSLGNALKICKLGNARRGQRQDVRQTWQHPWVQSLYLEQYEEMETALEEVPQ